MRSFVQAKALALLIVALFLLCLGGCRPPGANVLGAVPIYVVQPEAAQ